MDSHTKPRLIDANALKRNIEREIKVCHELFELGDKEAFKKYHGLKRSLELLDSAQTVETTDDVLARIPKFPQRMDYQCLIFDRGNWIFSNAEFEDNIYKPSDFAYGKTPLEAVKKLEEELDKKK